MPCTFSSNVWYHCLFHLRSAILSLRTCQTYTLQPHPIHTMLWQTAPFLRFQPVFITPYLYSFLILPSSLCFPVLYRSLPAHSVLENNWAGLAARCFLTSKPPPLPNPPLHEPEERWHSWGGSWPYYVSPLNQTKAPVPPPRYSSVFY